MSVKPTDQHLESQRAFARDDVVEFYATFLDDLLPCERLVFDRMVAPGARVLDLGVGTGRTTPFLSERASRYVGLDYSSGMLERCRETFPDLEFVRADASDLSQFSGGEFDVVVFSFNGIDCLHPDATRLRCLSEVHRVLADDGRAIFSEHNPRALLSRPRPLRGVPPKLAAARLGRATKESVLRSVRLLPTGMFWRGSGYYREPQHGGTSWHAATPKRAVAEIEQVGFRRVGEIVGDDHPRKPSTLRTGWFYYCFERAPAPSSDRP